MNLFEAPTKLNAAKLIEIKSWVRSRLQLEDDAVIMVTELECSEPGCPPMHTIIAVMLGPGQNQRYKIHKPVAEVTADDIIARM
jgi:hypothetical protein